jgi:hypothetical protein
LNGIISGAWGCSGTERWEVRLGTVLNDSEFITPYIRTSAGVSLPANPRLKDTEPLAGWEFVQSIKYAFVPEESFERSIDWKGGSVLSSPSLQQWSMLLDSEIALEIVKRNFNSDSYRRAWGVKFWQVLPPSWRTLGALRDTRNANAYGLTLKAEFQAGPWRAQVGAGRMTLAVDRIVASFFYPSVEISFWPGEAK